MNSETLQTNRLINTRKALNLSKTEAAKRLGITNASYSRYEAGLRQPSHQVISQIAEGLNTSVDYLTGKSNDDSPNKITISKLDNPDLFALIECISVSDSNTLKRLLSYYNSIKAVSH